MFKKAEIVNVQLEDAVPETSYLHSKYWTKYCGRYRLPLVAYNFLSEYFRTHTEFKVTMPGFGSSSDWYDDTMTRWFRPGYELIGFSKNPKAKSADEIFTELKEN